MVVSVRHTSINQQVGNPVECIADAKEDDLANFALIGGVWPVRYLVSKSNNTPKAGLRILTGCSCPIGSSPAPRWL
jgi:hypothetical protein